MSNALNNSHEINNYYNASSSSSSPSLVIGDYIGMESCVDLMISNELDHYSFLFSSNAFNQDDMGRNYKRRQRRQMKDHKDFPPPIPSLACTGNLPSRMPWVLKRRYTADGRLILTEEKVRHHDYFRAHRSNGRLTLQLVPIDPDEFYYDPDHHHQSGEKEMEESYSGADIAQEYYNVGPDHHDQDHEEDDTDDFMVESCDHDHEEKGSPRIGAGKCFNINNSPSIFEVKVPTIRPVLS